MKLKNNWLLIISLSTLFIILYCKLSDSDSDKIVVRFFLLNFPVAQWSKAILIKQNVATNG